MIIDRERLTGKARADAIKLLEEAMGRLKE